MIEVIIILACIGALYQWRHTDFVKAIVAVPKVLLSAIVILVLIFVAVSLIANASVPLFIALAFIIPIAIFLSWNLTHRRVKWHTNSASFLKQANQQRQQANPDRPQPMSEPVDEPLD
jgi:hypothetical protein